MRISRLLVLAVVCAGALTSTAGAWAGVKITSVTFTGRSQAPGVIVRGEGFGAKPSFNPAYAPESHQKCPKQNPALDGYDYKTNLWFADRGASSGTTRIWSAGRFTGPAELDCVGLIIETWTPVKVVFRFGSQYDREATSAAPSTYVLSSDDLFVVKVKSASFRGTTRLPS